MNTIRLPAKWIGIGLLTPIALLAGCSGSSEDVRVTFCKNLTTAVLPDAQSVEWKGNENTFRRPEYAVVGLTFEVQEKDGARSAGQSACHYAYEALEDTAVILADPFAAYATLPFKMTVDGVSLPDAELLRLVNAEQRRLGRKAVDTLARGARDLTDKVRGGIGQ